MLYCIPIYRQKYKTQKCKKVHVKQWTDESVNTLKACFECTEWDLLFDDEVCLDKNPVASKYFHEWLLEEFAVHVKR